MRFRERMKIVFLLLTSEIKDEADLTRGRWRGSDGGENPIKTAAGLEFI